MDSRSETVCVTGAAGFIGSWLVMRLIEHGYTVRATIRDPANMKKVKHLLEVPGAKTHLSLWKADLAEEGSFDEAIKGCTGVFHLATPTDYESIDPENEMSKPTINGVLHIMKACVKAKTVRRMIFTSSAGTVNVSEHQKPVLDETCWSDVDFCQRVKMSCWTYFLSKTLAEKEAWKFAQGTGLELITIIPTLVVGPFLSPAMPDSITAALYPITAFILEKMSALSERLKSLNNLRQNQKEKTDSKKLEAKAHFKSTAGRGSKLGTTAASVLETSTPEVHDLENQDVVPPLAGNTTLDKEDDGKTIDEML